MNYKHFIIIALLQSTVSYTMEQEMETLLQQNKEDIEQWAQKKYGTAEPKKLIKEYLLTFNKSSSEENSQVKKKLEQLGVLKKIQEMDKKSLTAFKLLKYSLSWCASKAFDFLVDNGFNPQQKLSKLKSGANAWVAEDGVSRVTAGTLADNVCWMYTDINTIKILGKYSIPVSKNKKEKFYNDFKNTSFEPILRCLAFTDDEIYKLLGYWKEHSLPVPTKWKDSWDLNLFYENWVNVPNDLKNITTMLLFLKKYPLKTDVVTTNYMAHVAQGGKFKLDQLLTFEEELHTNGFPKSDDPVGDVYLYRKGNVDIRRQLALHYINKKNAPVDGTVDTGILSVIETPLWQVAHSLGDEQVVKAMAQKSETIAEQIAKKVARKLITAQKLNSYTPSRFKHQLTNVFPQCLVKQNKDDQKGKEKEDPKGVFATGAMKLGEQK